MVGRPCRSELPLGVGNRSVTTFVCCSSVNASPLGEGSARPGQGNRDKPLKSRDRCGNFRFGGCSLIVAITDG